ncbi:hypothetical protein [Aeromonas hydrophila]|uniref:hypothetical protein n=1 Tax=Aeromonas hydrophila TaxID=644 RepID=UPI003D1D3B9A
MDYSKYNTYMCFYAPESASIQLDPDFGTVSQQVLAKVYEALGRVQFAKTQEYNVKEQEVQTCVIKLPWHPVIKKCTHVEIKTFYSTETYFIELQQMPFNDGELELKCRRTGG